MEIFSNGSGNVWVEDKKVYIYKKNVNRALNNDIVLVKLIHGKHRGSIEGKVIEIKERYTKQFTGLVQKVNDFGFLIPDSKRMYTDFFLTKHQVKKYNIGERLLVELTKWKKDERPECKVIKSLGMFGENDSEISSIIYEYNLNPEFPNNVEKESEDIVWDISEKDISERRDFRKINTFTIDPDTAEDFDDAISIRKINKGYEVGIHIADVTHYIKPNSKLDEEALKRSTSVYLVDRVIPMLPERISNGVCSLRPNEDKLTFSVIIKFNNKFDIIDKWIGKTIIRSDQKFSYDEVQNIINGETNIYKDEILILNELSQSVRRKRTSLLFNNPEMKFKMDEDFVPISVEMESNNESHQLIEELMLSANKIVGEYLISKEVGIFRNHDEPNEEKIFELYGLSKSLGFDLDMTDIRQGLNKLNQDIIDTPYENMISTLAIRTLDKAEYSINNIGHYGLNFKYYTHFTSPIRRYSDCISHRLLSNYLDIEKIEVNKSKIDDMCKHINQQEIIAKKAQRDSIKYKQIEYLLSRIGNKYSATITGISEWGVYAQIDENYCNGMISKNDIDGDIDSENYQINLINGKTFRLGDTINIQVINVSLLYKEINFIII